MRIAQTGDRQLGGTLGVAGAPTMLWPSDALIGASRGRREPVFLGITWPLPARAEGRWVGSTGVEGCDWVLGSNRRNSEESEISHCRKMVNFFGLFVCFLPCQTIQLFFPDVLLHFFFFWKVRNR